MTGQPIMTGIAAFYRSNSFRHAFKVALATVLAYWWALAWDWPNPKWSALAVAIVSLPAMGESMVKARDRLVGTVLAAMVALLLFRFFPQDRWLFVICLSAWQAFCVYQMAGTKAFYVWYCAGFIAAIVATYGITDPRDAFEFAVVRILETGMGVLVYTIVALLLWPKAEDLPAAQADNPPASAMRPIFPDLDRLCCAANYLTLFWLGYLAVIYVPDIPSGLKLMGLLASLSMMLAFMPQVPIRLIYRPIAVSIVLSSLFYMFLMPKLSGFGGLAIAVFCVTFLIGYIFYAPDQFIGRSLGLALFVSVIGVANEQQYSFLAVANVSLMIGVICFLATLTRNLPLSTLPEKRFLWQLARFQRSAQYLSRDTEGTGPLSHYRREFHRYEVATLPDKMAGWRNYIPPALQEPVSGELDTVMTHVKDVAAALLHGGGQRDETLAKLRGCHETLRGSAMLEPRY